MDPMEHMGLALNLISKRRPTIHRSEALSIAWEALSATAEHFDESRGNKFGTLLRWYVMSTLQKRGKEDMCVVYQPEKKMRDDGHFTYIREGLADTLMYEDPTTSHEDEYELVWETAHRILDEREIDMMKRYYVEEYNYEEIASVYELSRARVHQIISRSITKIREAIDDIDAR